MRRVVISQPMLFPWAGLLEQVRLADVFVHYDDVQLPQGQSFITRVQVKTANGPQWMTVPVQSTGGPQLIRDAVPDDSKDWRQKHRGLLATALAGAPYLDDALALLDRAYDPPTTTLADLNRRCVESVAMYFGFRPEFLLSSTVGSQSTSSEKLLEVVQAVGGDVYITGHGALNYLNHDLFESSGVRVEYMDYRKAPYPQLHGSFTPSVTILDLVANCGPAGRDVIFSPSVYWKEFQKS